MDVKWNANGNWLLTASRDHLLKIFDIRNLKEEMQTFRGHKKEVSTSAWHPVHEGIFASGGSDGSIMFWSVGADKEVGAIETAHDNWVWALSWHPAGNILKDFESIRTLNLLIQVTFYVPVPTIITVNSGPGIGRETQCETNTT